MPEPIIFYDIPNVQGNAWSGNTWKTRFTLNYKGLPYKTVWVEYPDIEKISKELGIPPTGAWSDGSPKYTLPAISDPSTGEVVADSANIARYLDTTYPDTPRVIPEGTDALHEALNAAITHLLTPNLFYVLVPKVYPLLNDASKVHFKVAREKDIGPDLENWSPDGSALREKHWAGLETAFGKIAGWLTADGEDRKFFVNDQIAFADFIVGGRLMWMKSILGKDSEEWKRVEQWHGGRWARLLEALETLPNRSRI